MFSYYVCHQWKIEGRRPMAFVIKNLQEGIKHACKRSEEICCLSHPKGRPYNSTGKPLTFNNVSSCKTAYLTKYDIK